MAQTDEQVMAHGRSDAEVFNAPPSLARSASDWATSAIRGLARGAVATVGQAGDIPGLINQKAEQYGLIPPRDPNALYAFPPSGPFPTTEKLIEKIGGEGKDKNAVGKFMAEKPGTPGGRYAESIGEFVPGMVGGEGSLLRKGVQAAAGGAGSQAGGELATKLAPDHEMAGRVLGAITGQGLPGMVRRAVAPSAISPERQAAASVLRKEGVEPTAGDVSGSRTLKYAEHGLGDAPGAGAKYATARERIGEQFTSAVLKRVGETGNRATPDVVDRAFRRIGGDFDTLSARNSAQIDPQYLTELYTAQADYDHLFVDPLKRPVVEKVMDHALNQLIKSGTMDGAQYQAVRSRIERMRRSYAADPEVSDFLGDVRKSMDDLMERNIAQHNPGDLGAWQQARREYRNMLVLEKAATGASEDAHFGIVTPAKLREAVVSQSRRGYARGQGDFAELARAGAGLLKPPPTSGTAERAWLHAIPAAVGAGLGEMAGGNLAALPAAMAGVAAPGVVGRGLMSSPVQGYLKNQVAEKLGISPAALDALSPSMLDKIVRAALAEHAHEQR